MRVLPWFLLLSLLALSWGRPRCSAAQPPAQAARHVGPERRHLQRLCDTTEFLLLSDNARAEAASRQVVRQARRRGYLPELAQGYLLLGNALRNKSQFDSSLYYGQQALRLFEAQQRPDGQAAVYTLLAHTYKRMGDAQRVQSLTRTALRWATQARQVARQGPFYRQQSRAAIVQGIIYRDLGQLDSAKACYLVSMALERQHPYQPSSLPVAYADYGQALMDQDDNLAEAIRYFRRALPLYRQQGNRNGQEHAYRNLSWAYRRQHRYPPAVAAADSALQLGRAIQDPHRLSNSLQAAYLAYRDAGRLAPALRYLEEEREVEQQLANVEVTRAVATVAAQYQSERLREQLHRLAQDQARRTRQLWALGAALLVLCVTLAVALWQYRVGHRAQAQLAQTNGLIQANNQRITEQAARLTMLLQELHHRVKNNLAIVSSLLRLQANRLSEPGAVQAVRESQQRVEAMALIHQRLYQTDAVTTVNMQTYVADLTDRLRTAYGYSEDFSLELDVRLLFLAVDVAVPLGLLLNELLTNAFKHAYPQVDRPWLRIYLAQITDGDFTGALLEVQDNGPGISAAQWAAVSSTFGKRLITSLSEQIGGEMLLLPSENGTLYRLRIPQ